MERILTVAASQQGQLLLQQLLQELPLPGSQHASTGAAARKLLQEEQFDLVLINAPLSDEYGDLVAKLAFSKSAAVILLIKAEHIDAVREKIAQIRHLYDSKTVETCCFSSAGTMYSAAGKKDAAAARRTGSSETADAGN